MYPGIGTGTPGSFGANLREKMCRGVRPWPAQRSSIATANPQARQEWLTLQLPQHPQQLMSPHHMEPAQYSHVVDEDPPTLLQQQPQLEQEEQTPTEHVQHSNLSAPPSGDLEPEYHQQQCQQPFHHQQPPSQQQLEQPQALQPPGPLRQSQQSEQPDALQSQQFQPHQPQLEGRQDHQHQLLSHLDGQSPQQPQQEHPGPAQQQRDSQHQQTPPSHQQPVSAVQQSTAQPGQRHPSDRVQQHSPPQAHPQALQQLQQPQTQPQELPSHAVQQELVQLQLWQQRSSHRVAQPQQQQQRVHQQSADLHPSARDGALRPHTVSQSVFFQQPGSCAGSTQLELLLRRTCSSGGRDLSVSPHFFVDSARATQLANNSMLASCGGLVSDATHWRQARAMRRAHACIAASGRAHKGLRTRACRRLLKSVCEASRGSVCENFCKGA
eukprot:6199858-Pleurochrysis_carterae.AAC.3